MANLSQLLAGYRGTPSQQLLCVFNPVSGADRTGRGPAAQAAANLQTHLQSGFRFSENRYQVSLLETVDSRPSNIASIAEQIGELSRDPRPLTVLGFGGDGTFELVITGYLTHLFRDVKDLRVKPRDEIRQRLKNDRTRLGLVQSGSANDLGGLYGTPQAKKVGDMVTYLAESVETTLHLGLATVHHPDREEIYPFVHTFSAGYVFTPILVDAKGMRGTEAMRWMLRNGLKRILNRADPRLFRWKRSNGEEGEMPAFDCLSHAIPRIAKAVAVPGLPPFEGLGFKVVPEGGTAARLVIGAEIFSSGLLSRLGSLSRLTQGAKLVTVPENHQQVLEVGDWIEFDYADSQGEATEIGYQLSGDGIGYTKGPIRILALPAIEHFMMMPGSPMGRLLYKNLIQGK